MQLLLGSLCVGKSGRREYARAYRIVARVCAMLVIAVLGGCAADTGQSIGEVSAPLTAVYQINCGGPAVTPFSADQFFSGGSTYANANAIVTSGVTGAAPAGVYQSERYGNQTYTIGGLTAGAAYTVRLHFAEIYWTSAGVRVFNVAINGSQVLANFDIFAVAGANKAVVRDFSATANGSGQIVIQYTTVKDNAKSSGIEILSGASNQPPTVATAASASPNPVNGSTANLSVLGADDGGESNLTYTWATSGTPAAPVSFSVNGTNAAKNTVATFTQSGTYTLQATIADAQGLTTTSSVSVVVNLASSALFRINCGGGAVSPFTADQFASGGSTYTSGNAVQTSGVANAAPAAVYQSERFGNHSYTFSGLTSGTSYTVRLHFAEIYWTSAGARVFNVAINGTQVLSNFDIFATAGANKAVVKDFAATANGSGQIVIQFTTVKDNAKSSGIEILSSGSSGNQAPTIASAAVATPNPVNGTTTNLSVLGADDGGEANLTYTWRTAGTPPAAVVFSANGTNAAKNTVASFSASGAYTLQVTISDAQGLTATSSVNVSVTVGAVSGPLRVDSVNPRYFSNGTRVVYLTGSHTWQTFKDRSLTDPPPAFDYTAFLDFLVAHNHNFFRLWTWEQPHSWNNNTDGLKRYFDPFPWPRTGPGTASDGKPCFDLSQFVQSYFDRMRSRVVAAGNRGIYVAITLFDGWDLANAYNPTDGGFPYGSGNNVNGIAVGGPESQNLSNSAVTAIQDAYVRKVIDSVNDLDNVLYEIANETNAGGVAWQYHMVDLIKQYEAGKPKRHPVGMTSTYPGSDSDLYNSNADWIAPNSQLLAGDGRKVIINDTDHSYYWTALKNDGQAAQQAWAWKTFLIGAAPAFMDPYLEPWSGRNNPSGTTPDPYWEILRYAMGYTRRYADRLDLEHAVPSGSLSSTGYCLANSGVQYLVYQPGSGAFTLNVAAGTYSYEWFNPDTGTVAQSGTTTLASGTATFTPPFSGDAVLFLFR